MKKYTTKIGIYDASTHIQIDTYTLTSVARCQQIIDRRALANAKNVYRGKRVAELVNRYGNAIYSLVDDGIINPLDKIVFAVI